MFDRLFIDHPADVDETYFEHLRTASWFAGTMAVAALACFIHALIPGLFVTTGSGAIARLHERMIVNRRRIAARDTSRAPADA